MSDGAVRSALWWVCLLLAPLGLIAVELFHPAGFTAIPGCISSCRISEAYQPQFQALGYFGPMWWFTLHMIQTPMVALVVVGLWLILARCDWMPTAASPGRGMARPRRHPRVRDLLHGARCDRRHRARPHHHHHRGNGRRRASSIRISWMA